jgi:hypothetical protein
VKSHGPVIGSIPERWAPFAKIATRRIGSNMKPSLYTDRHGRLVYDMTPSEWQEIAPAKPVTVTRKQREELRRIKYGRTGSRTKHAASLEVLNGVDLSPGHGGDDEKTTENPAEAGLDRR